MPAKRRAAGTGSTRQLASGRWQARFRGDDGLMRPAPVTFDTRLDANAWLVAQARDLAHGTWAPPESKTTGGTTLKEYADTWLAHRELKPRTRLLYRSLLDSLVLPELGSVRLDRVSPTTVRNWYATLNPDTPTRRAHAYALLRAIYKTAVIDGLVPASPCRLERVGSGRAAHRTVVLTPAEVDALVGAMPDRYRAMVLLATWCALRFGELAELRRKDLDLAAQVVRVERAVTSRDGQVFVGTPKSEAGTRSVDIPPHIVPALQAHLDRHVAHGKQALLFPARSGRHLAPTTFYTPWSTAREKAGRHDLHFHDLRHTGLTFYAQMGATQAEIMARGGHSTAAAAQRYQHAADDRKRALAGRLSDMATDAPAGK